MPVLEGSTNVSKCEPRECCTCACTSKLLSLQGVEEEEVSAVCACVQAQSLAVAACVTSHVSVLYLSVWCLWKMFSALQLVEPAMRKAVATCPSLGRDPMSPGAGLGASSQVGAVLGWSG